MRFTSTVLAIAASLTVVSAQVDLSQIPACALPCLIAATAASGCSSTDYKCQCTTGTAKITASLQACVPSKCSASDQQKLVDASAKICLSVGVTISSAASPATSAAQSAASSASAAVSMANASAASSASAAIGSAMASASASMSMAMASSTGAAPATTNAAVSGNYAGMGAVVFGVAALVL